MFLPINSAKQVIHHQAPYAHIISCWRQNPRKGKQLSVISCEIEENFTVIGLEPHPEPIVYYEIVTATLHKDGKISLSWKE
jgi:hypothetical protein